MAVDVIHLASPAQAYTKMAFEHKSKSMEGLNVDPAFPKVANGVTSTNVTECSSQRPISGSDKSSIGSLLDFSLIERSELAVDQLVASRKQLEDEIEVCVCVCVCSL